jgi:hypothetical protein
MTKLLRAGAVSIAILGSASFAAAQNAPGYAHPELTSNQQHAISQGLAGSPSQSAPGGGQPQVGNQVPDSMSAQALPSNVTDQVPEAKHLFFVKLPDRIMLIDPDTKLVTQIVMSSDSDSATTGSSAGSSSGTAGQPNR